MPRLRAAQTRLCGFCRRRIKGIPGGQSAGTALISTNENAFESYGLDDMSCAPVCIECAEASIKALNKLLATDTSNTRINPLVYAYWARESDTARIGMMLSEPNPGEVAELLEAVRTGNHGALGVPGDEFYCVGLRPERRACRRPRVDRHLYRAR